MKIRELFSKKIDRPINGVIKVGQDDLDNIYQELSEYVVTKEINRHFDDFYNAYAKCLDGPTDKMGVWIAGFFGSGKSHLLKIISYLLENKEVHGRTTLDFFKEKIADPMLFATIGRSTRGSVDVILFNIESKSDADSKTKKDAIVKVFMKVFNEMQGFCGSIPWLAEMERELAGSGSYQTFKDTFASLAGEKWEVRRDSFYFERDTVIQALAEATGMSIESAGRWFDNGEDNYTLSVEKFASLVHKYCESKGPDHRVIFLADEVGQYVGDSTDLMINLQTVVEDLGRISRGRVWVIVTSQQDIDLLTKETVKSNDFSKIQGRFNTRINLSSANTDEVIKKRLLEKMPAVKDALESYYQEKSAVLNNLISFSADTAEMKTYRDALEFADSYPFIPYQFKLLQNVFEAIRKFGASGKHLSEGERSMLSAFQVAATNNSDRPLSALIPFSAFYPAIESFLDSSIRRTFIQAGENERLRRDDCELLKVLFMLKYVKEMRANLENLTTLMVSEIDEDKISLRRSIRESLERLKAETLIQQNGDEYTFLTDEEQDVNREIKKTAIDENDVLDHAATILFHNIYKDPRYKSKSNNIFDFNKQIDRVYKGGQTCELTLRFVTPYGDDYYLEQKAFALSTSGASALVIKLPDDSAFLNEIEEILKIEKFVKKRGSIKNSGSIQRIIDAKSSEIAPRNKRVEDLLEEAVVGAEFFVHGEKLQFGISSAREAINQGMEILVKNEYHKLDYLAIHYSFDDLADILKAKDIEVTLFEGEVNQLALQEIRQHLEIQGRRHLRVTMKSLLDLFTKKPYGWLQMDLAALVAILFVRQEIKLKYNEEILKASSTRILDYLTKRTEWEKLVIQLRNKLDQGQILAAKNLARDIFGTHTLPDDEDGLARGLKDLLLDKLQRMQEHLTRYVGGSPYPGRSVLETGQASFKELVSIHDGAALIPAFLQKKSDLLDWQENVEPVMGFFTSNQVQLFDRALDSLKRCRNNLVYLNSSKEIMAQAETISNIIGMVEPYHRIKELPALVVQMEQEFSRLLNELKETTAPVLESYYNTVNELLSLANVSVSLAGSINAQYESLLRSLQECRDFHRVDALRIQGERWRDESLKKINKELYKTPGTAGREGELKERQIKIFCLTGLTRGKSTLRSQADVDNFLEQLRKMLEELIKENDIQLS